jgi:hypothetical protein
MMQRVKPRSIQSEPALWGQMLDTLATMSDEAVLYRSQGRLAEPRSVFTEVREV